MGIAAAAVLCVVGLALDITSIVYTSRQIHMYRKKKQASKSPSSNGDHSLDKTSLSGSTSSASLTLNGNQHKQFNNNKIYLKSIDRELCSDYDLCSWVTSPSGGSFTHNKPLPCGELWADVVSSSGSLWQDECIKGMVQADEKPSISRRSSESWEKVRDLSHLKIQSKEIIYCRVFG